MFRKDGALDTTYYLRFYANFTSIPSSGANILRWWNNAGSVEVLSLRIGAGDVLQLYSGAGTQIGSDSAALSTGVWYRVEVEVRVATGGGANSTAKARIDGTEFAASSAADLNGSAPAKIGVGLVLSPGTSKVMYMDDLALNDNSGSAQNTYPGAGKVVLLTPVSDNARATLWTGGAGGTTNLYDAVNTTPPAGLISGSSSNTSQIEHGGGAAGTTDAYAANMTSYSTAGVGASDTITLIQPWVIVGEDITTGTKLLKHQITSNPTGTATGNIDASSPTTTSGVTTGLAVDTYPTGWYVHQGTIDYAPSVTLATQPVLSIIRPETAAGVASSCFMAILVEYVPGPTGQFARPDADTAAGTWTTAPLWSKIDETAASDADFISSSTTSGSTCTIGLSNVTDPAVSTGHIVRYRYTKSATAGADPNITVEVLEGTTARASSGAVAVPDSTAYNDGTFTLTGGEADAITDYTALHLRFTMTRGGGSARGIRVSWAELEVPAVSGDATGTVTAGPVAVVGGSVTATAGTGATGTVTAGAILVGGGTVNAGVSDTGTVSAGAIAVVGGSVTATAGTGDTGTVTAGAVLVVGGTVDGTVSATGDVTAGVIAVVGGTVTGTDTGGGVDATGTVTAGAIAVGGSSVTATAGAGDTGTVSAGAIAVGGGSVTGDAGTGATGTISTGAVAVAGGTVTATAGTGDTGTVSAGAVLVGGSSVTGAAGATGEVAAGAILVGGGAVTGSGDVSGDATGLVASGGISVAGGTVTATAGQSATGTVSAGAILVGGSTVSGTVSVEGTVTAGAIAVTGGSVDGTAGQGVTASVAAGAILVGGSAVIGNDGVILIVPYLTAAISSATTSGEISDAETSATISSALVGASIRR
jgi:hypothetical protein